MTDTAYNFLFIKRFRWSEWAAPKTAEGKPDLDCTGIGGDLVEFVNNAQMPYLRGFSQSATAPGYH